MLSVYARRGPLASEGTGSGKRFDITRDAQGTRIERLEAGIVNQLRREVFRLLIVSAVNEARRVALAPRCLSLCSLRA